MNEGLASELIKKNLQERNPYLDLGNCGLTNLDDIPELFDCVHLETLVLSDTWYEYEKGKEVKKISQNKGNANRLKTLSSQFDKLKNLNRLVCFANEITDISPLQVLTTLTDLDLSGNEITDISFLQVLTDLTYLDMSENEIIDISFMKTLTSLTNLDLSYNQITDISSLQALTDLTDLDLSSNEITDISSLQALTDLTDLDLSYNEITDISSLQALTALMDLHLWGNQITDISSLQALTALTDLDLSSNQITDISSLQILTALTDLNLKGNEITDLSPLQSLTALMYFDLSDTEFINNISSLEFLTTLIGLSLENNQITDISSLKSLTYLTDLTLWSNQITDISSLESLTDLTRLYLDHNQITDISFLQPLTNLTDLNLKGNPIPYIPKEIYQLDNCIEELRAYWAELEASRKINNNQLKIMFLGNGCAGKTTLLHWFIDNEFKDIGLESRTHGIFIKPLPLCDNKILGNFWDFGGQEIYHATHRLFLGRRTLYILIWATETPEKETEQRHPPQYWLDMIADIGDKQERSRVLIVQNLFDKQAVQNILSNEDIQDYTTRGLDISTISVNAKSGHKIKSFKTHVEEEVENLINTYQEELPQTWADIRTAVATQRENKVKVLSWADFEQICRDCELKKSPPSVVIGYLHRAGEVYYYENQFDNQIILDQEWALKAVYAVLKRKRIEQYKGIFQLEDLIDIWQSENPDLTKEDAQIFLNFMLSNHIMFYTKEGNRSNEVAEFVIPQLLEPTMPDSVEALKGKSDGVLHQIEYAFLHRDIIERFIVKTAQFSEKKEYWRNGVYIKYENARAIIEVIETQQTEKKKIQIECFGTHPEHLLQKIREEFDKIRSLDKAKEFRFIDKTWQPFDTKRIATVSDNKHQKGFEDKIQEDVVYNELAPFIRKIFKEETEKNINHATQSNKMALVSLKEHLQDLVIESKIDKALSTLLTWSKKNNDDDLNNTVVLLTSRFNALEKQIQGGLIDEGTATRNTNQIVYALKSTINDLPKNAQIEVAEKVYNPITEERGNTSIPPPPIKAANTRKSVFISYNHKDAESANKIKQRLEMEKIDVVIDSENLKAGEDIKMFIEKSVRENGVTLSVVSANSLMSAWVAMESVNTLYAQKVTDKKFIAACIDSSFFKRSFVDDALDKIEEEIKDIKATITKRLEKGRNITDLQNELSRYMDLQHNLPNIVQGLKESLSVDVSGDNFDKGMDKINASIAS